MLLMQPLLLLLALALPALCRAIDREDLLLMSSENNVRTGTLPPVATAMVTPKVITIDDGYVQILWPFATTTVTLCITIYERPTPEPEPEAISTVSPMPVQPYSSVPVPLRTPESNPFSSAKASATSAPTIIPTTVSPSYENTSSTIAPEPTPYRSSSITTPTSVQPQTSLNLPSIPPSAIQTSSQPQTSHILSSIPSKTSFVSVTRTSTLSTPASRSPSSVPKPTTSVSPSPVQSTQPASNTTLQPYCAVYHEKAISQIQGPALKYVVSPIDDRWGGLTFLDKLSNCGDTFNHVYRETGNEQYPGHHVEFDIKQPTEDQKYAELMQCVQKQIQDSGGPYVWCMEWDQARSQMCEHKARGYKPYLGCDDEQQYQDLMQLP